MRLVLYALAAIIAFLVFKAFYLDAYLAERKAAEANVSSETNVSVLPEAQTPPSVPAPKPAETNATPPKAPYSDMPLERAGEKIAETIGSKF
ncbi:MAG: hypothetical protein PHV10_02020 [Sulfuricurvum sp.]|nr:hypothetical protein [Sulfuricurvum sp.]